MELTHLFNTDNIGVGEQRERWIYTRKSDIIGIKSALWQQTGSGTQLRILQQETKYWGKFSQDSDSFAEELKAEQNLAVRKGIWQEVCVLFRKSRAIYTKIKRDETACRGRVEK